MNVVFHIGYPKAASTTLQKCLFKDHSEIINLGIYPTNNVGRDSNDTKLDNVPILNDPRLASFHHSLTQLDGVLFEAGKVAEDWASLLANYSSDRPTIVASNEAILSPRFANQEIVEKARRIYKIYPNAKILIIIRSQVNMLTSLYRDHPFDPRFFGHQIKPVSFSKWLELDLKLSRSSLTNTLLFNRVIGVYEQLFPKEKILVLPLELLKHQSNVFAEKLSLFLEVSYEETLHLLSAKPENQGISTLGNKYRRWRSQLMPYARFLKPIRGVLEEVDRSLFNTARLLGNTETINVSEADMFRLREKFSEDNALLAERLNLPLAELGYLTVKQ